MFSSVGSPVHNMIGYEQLADLAHIHTALQVTNSVDSMRKHLLMFNDVIPATSRNNRDFPHLPQNDNGTLEDYISHARYPVFNFDSALSVLDPKKNKENLYRRLNSGPTSKVGRAIDGYGEQKLCWSSYRMTELMTWRNNDTSLAKKVSTGLCLPLLTITSMVEQIAYKAISLVAKVLSPITQLPTNYVSKEQIDNRYHSANFTSWWTIACLWQNCLNIQLPENESEARKSNHIFRLHHWFT